MKKYIQLSSEEKSALYASLKAEHEEYKKKGLSLDLSRGKPNGDQLDMCNGLLSVDLSDDHFSSGGFDCRNYGLADGLPEMKRFFSELMGLSEESIIIGGNSSLQLMYDTLSAAMIFGVPGAIRPWSKEDGLKWICVTPGYDRHFRITEMLGFELLSVPMLADGPDMDEVERLVKDPKVKGIWCVPKYSNPTGNTYTEQTVRRLASMECAAPDFRIMWDNAYGIHDFSDKGDQLPDIFSLLEEYGNEDRVYYYSSTSKVSFPGGGVAFMAASKNNKSGIMKHLTAQTIGYDKLNQLRHLRFFGSPEAMRRHILSLGEIIGEKFEVALKSLSSLSGLGIADWTSPKGGYFISVNTMEGTAGRVYELAKEAGVTLTQVGATFPYGKDPRDSNIRLAPTYPSLSDLRVACDILVLSIKMAALEKLGENS